ncbi:FdtA/QdtA family cupin domain-containing protein [Candidatus Peregrinibacteria bacterium]|nr:FdtA/QdtA family cupin domain-containing protein [Candidatus Peregrinibacteria bacterium]
MPSSFFELTLPKFSEQNGTLVPTEFDEKFPFKVKRVYFLKNVPQNTTRGAHCHHIEEEVFVCIQGKCRALIDADGKGKQEIWLDSPEKAIYVGTKVWHEFDSFSEDAVLLAFSSTHYLPGKENYESDYENFTTLFSKI